MKLKSVIFFALCFFVLSGSAQNNLQKQLSPRIASYEMDVILDVEKKIIYGEEILTWHNSTSHSTRELQFHLYYNAWRNTHSSFLSASRYGWLKFRDYRDDEWAYCRVKSMRLLDENGNEIFDLGQNMEYIQPDDGNPDDRTVMRTFLPSPALPGDTVQVRIIWESKVPRTFARTGFRNNYFFIAQWFPKIGVFEEDGTWNCHQFIQTEFYADFGNYDVKLTVPEDWVVGATGKEIARNRNEDGTVTHRYYQEDVQDFAWTTSPHFEIYEDRFTGEGLPAVNLRLLVMPYNRDKVQRYFESTKMTLSDYGRWFGPYPYEQLTIIDPAYNSHTGGMEYPTLFTGGTDWFSPEKTRSPEGVTIHEAGHQFWYGIVANNEFEHAWLDEGFNSYSQAKVMEKNNLQRYLSKRYFHDFLPVVWSDIPLPYRAAGADEFEGFCNNLKLDPLAQPAYQNAPGAYRVNAYTKPTLILRTLENYLGWETFQKVLSVFFTEWQFRHPAPEDFFEILNRESSQNMDWFINQVYYTANVFDYAVDEIRIHPVKPPKGYVESGDSLIFQKPAYRPPGTEADTLVADTIAENGSQVPGVNKEYISQIYVRRWGEGIFPVEVKIIFDNGKEVIEHWEGRSRWQKWEYQRAAKPVKVVVDPRRVLVLDINSVNNSWMADSPSEKAAWKWTSKWMVWLQNLMEFFAFFS